jgi:hypothetical protein
MTDIAVNKGMDPFQMSLAVYRNLILNWGWKHVGVYDMNREMGLLTEILTTESAGVVPVVNTNGSGNNGTLGFVDQPPFQIGGNATVTFTPDPGYFTQKIVVDGVDCGAGADAFKITSLNNNHIVGGSFALEPTLTANQELLRVFRTAGGEVDITYTTGTGTTAYKHGSFVYDTTDYIITINAYAYDGFTIDQVLIDGEIMPTLGANYNTNYATVDSNAPPSKIVVYFKPTIVLDIPINRTNKIIWQDTRGRWYTNILDFYSNWQPGRADPDLIAAIKQVKASGGASAANGGNAIIQIITIPNDVTNWMIVKDCNGREVVTTAFEKWDM